MNLRLLLLPVLFFLFVANGIAQDAHTFSADVSISKDLQKQFEEDGRLYLFLSTSPYGEPRFSTWPSPSNKTYIFAKNMTDVKAKQPLQLSNSNDWVTTGDWSLNEVPTGEYNVQVLWDQDESESRIDAPGNLYSKPKKITIDQNTSLNLVIDQVIAERKITEHELVKEITYQSEILSEWWDKPMMLKASVLLPHNYQKGKAYPIRYNVAGYGGRYTRINSLANSERFMTWWESDDAPEIITVFLDGEGPFGDSYQMDSDNSGPYGEVLTKELIPFIESKYRGTDDADTRFVDGCSTGGWVSLGLQLYYPDVFGGCYSYSPDSVEFENYQLINIYKDKNAYTNEFGYARPVMRGTDGEPMLTLKEFIQYENTLGSSNTYLNSGGQFSAHTALYSPKGENGLPKPLFDPVTGEIDAEVAEYWKKYDFKLHAQENWETLGPKLQGKIYLWMGDMDHFYLNPATRAFADFIETTTNPKSDAVIEFSAMEGHCSKYSHIEVLKMIAEKVENIKK